MTNTIRIGETGHVTLEGRTFELEKSTHHHGKPFTECERDCPQGWTLPTYWLLQGVRNSEHRDYFNLLETHEYVQQPDNISRETGTIASFDAGSDALRQLVCNWVQNYSAPALGVRYVREVPKSP